MSELRSEFEKKFKCPYKNCIKRKACQHMNCDYKNKEYIKYLKTHTIPKSVVREWAKEMKKGERKLVGDVFGNAFCAGYDKALKDLLLKLEKNNK